MASTTRRLALGARHFSSRICIQRLAPRFVPSWQQRPLSTTPLRRADPPTNDIKRELSEEELSEEDEEDPFLDESFFEEDEVDLSNETTEEKDKRELAGLVEQLESVQDMIEKKKTMWKATDPYGLDMNRFEEDPKDGFWSEGEPELGPDDDYFADDITSHGHGQLEQHRELREYARLIAWELPLLNQLARPFEPPTDATPFRFRYTSYLGERHPAVNKVVVEFCAKDMKLSPIQTDKLIKLAGVRYNPSKDIIKLSCEQFDTQAQNKRFLGETINKLLQEAKDGKDTFADVPFDFRHHKPKPFYEFPKEWRLTPERKKYLDEKRAQALLADQEKDFKGALIDGNKVVESSLPWSVPEPEPVMVAAPRGKKGR